MDFNQEEFPFNFFSSKFLFYKFEIERIRFLLITKLVPRFNLKIFLSNELASHLNRDDKIK